MHRPPEVIRAVLWIHDFSKKNHIPGSRYCRYIRKVRRLGDENGQFQYTLIPWPIWH
jgi:hypothetical protein